ncbi:MAG TPA: glycoside hydrolase domain-containing protein, partial [Puia sp.]
MKIVLLAAFLACGPMQRSMAGDSIPVPASNVRYIDPTIGNVGRLLEPTRPTVQLPNQLIRFTPQRKDYMDDQISDFPLTIVSHRLGQVFALKPSIHGTDDDAFDASFTYDHDLEVNRPWYYATWLIDDNIGVEFTAGRRTGLFRIQFPSGEDKALLFAPYNDGDPGWQFPSAREITGVETYHGDIKVYLYGEFNTPGTAVTQGRRTGVRFAANVRTVEFRYAISYISAGQAKKTFDEEIKGRSFEQLSAAGQMEWTSVMSKINVTGGTTSQKRAFYTALYRCYERMVDITEDGSYYSGYDKQVHKDARPFYVDDWSWDTYLALHPLRMILEPSREQDMLQSYVRMYEQSGWMPTFPVL